MNRTTPRSARGLFVVCAVLLGSALLGGLYGSSVRATAGDPADLQESIRQFTQVVAVAQQNYATPIDADKAVYNGAIPGMLRELDPHSVFFDREAFSVQREDQRGKYFGVGMSVAPRDNHTVVMAPFVGSPAYKAGIRPGDIIAKVDGKPCDGLTTTEVAERHHRPHRHRPRRQLEIARVHRHARRDSAPRRGQRHDHPPRHRLRACGAVQ